MPHPKGSPKTPGSGRKAGTSNKSTAQVQAIARLFVDDPDYRAALKSRLLAGEAGAMESLLWQLAYGKPGMPSDNGTVWPATITIEF